MNKIRVIDLLNKIAKGEEIPKKIKLDEEIYEFNKWGNDYKLIGVEYSSWLFNDYCFGSNGNRLNNEVEIIEEDKDIEEIIEGDWHGNSATGNEGILKTKVNELVREVNKLKGKYE